MVTFIDEYRVEYGVDPICAMLPIAQSTYDEAKARQRDPSLRSDREKRDEILSVDIRRVHAESHRGAYGQYKVWRQLNKEDISAARCTVARLMPRMGLKGATRGGKKWKTTVPDDMAAKPLDLVEWNFTASRPNELWVADFTYVAT